jgi:excisionase family DNA binding protein
MPPARGLSDAPRLWTVEDLCRFLNVSKRWVHERTRRGEIPCYRLGTALRFDPKEIESWVAKFHRSPGEA